MKSAYGTSGKIFQQVSMRYQPGLLEQLQSIDKQDIVVVQGTYDHVEKLLDTIKILYTIIYPHLIPPPRAPPQPPPAIEVGLLFLFPAPEYPFVPSRNDGVGGVGGGGEEGGARS